MSDTPTSRPHTSAGKFLRIAGVLWLAVLLAIASGALLAPHIGRMVDVVLHYTAYRSWTLLTLHPAETFVDLSTPARTVKSYYSAVYRRDAATIEQLTAGPFREQMRQRLAHAEGTPANTTYRSYLHTAIVTSQGAVVLEKFHLFWQRGLRFSLAQHGTGWHIVGVELVQ